MGFYYDSNEKQPLKYLLALEDLDAQPDQLLTYSFWADDLGADFAALQDCLEV